MKSQRDEAYHLYKTYWKLLMPQCLEFWDMENNRANRQRLHESHKKVYGCKTIAGQDYDFLASFLFEIEAWYAVECGLFLRTSLNQPEDIAERTLADSWDYL